MVQQQQLVAPQDPQQLVSAGYPHTLSQEQLAAFQQQLAGAVAAPEHVPAVQAHLPAASGSAPGAPDQDAMMGLSPQEQHMANLAAALGQHADHHMSKPDQVCLPFGELHFVLRRDRH